MEYKLISVLGYNEFCTIMKAYFDNEWSIYMNVVVTPTYRTESINLRQAKRIDYEMYTQWIMRSKEKD